jgi:trimeric autotransporter adhesin
MLETLSETKGLRFLRYVVATSALAILIVPLAACNSQTAQPNFTIANINVLPAFPATIVAGTSLQFQAIATFSDGYTTYEITSDVTWTSSNVTVATISKSGLASALAEGTTVIAASFPGIPFASAKLKVDPGVVVPEIKSITVTPKILESFKVGSTQQFTAIAAYADGSNVDVTSKVNWKSSDKTIATIDNVTMGTVYHSGLSTAISPGSCVISASLSGLTSPPVNLTVVAR